jgi:hypothetical protein
VEEKIKYKKSGTKYSLPNWVYGFRVAYIYTCIFGGTKKKKKLAKYLHVYM